MLSQAAIDTGRHIIGGSIPESDPSDRSKVYNTMTVWNPNGQSSVTLPPLSTNPPSADSPGEMIAKYRKMHLYDVDIPGGITMRESDVISPGSSPLVVRFRELRTYKHSTHP